MENIQPVIVRSETLRLPDPAEIEKLKAEWRREQRSAEIEHNNRRAELIGIRSQLHVTQQKLDHETRSRRLDAVQAASRISSLERQLAEAQLALAVRVKSEARQGAVRLRLSAGATAAAVAVAVVGWSRGAPAAPAPRSVPVPQAPQIRREASVPVPKTHREFSRSLSRLDDALSSFPSQSAEAVFAAVAVNNAGQGPTPCPLQWNGGQPALLYSGGALGNSLSATLDHCAEAVERYRKPAQAH